MWWLQTVMGGVFDPTAPSEEIVRILEVFVTVFVGPYQCTHL